MAELGLGLAISKRLAEMMGGSVGAASVVGKGSTFWAELQLRPAEVPFETDKPKQWAVAPLDKCLRVLVAEDNRVNQKLTMRIYSCSDVNSRSQITAQSCGRYSPPAFDAVLMDYECPSAMVMRQRLRFAK